MKTPLRVQKLLQTLTLLITLNPVVTGYYRNVDYKFANIAINPEFQVHTIKEVHANLGQTILLPCEVRNLGDKVVSWIRTRDLHILTSASHIFSADNRFESVHSDGRNFWGLRIRGVRSSDSGRYECQVNTDPKMSLAIDLLVTDFNSPDNLYIGYKLSGLATIKGPQEIRVQEGSSFTLTCEVTSFLPSSPTLPTSSWDFPKAHVVWMHNGHNLSFDVSRRGISIETDYKNHHRLSRLRVDDVQSKDAGLYTCGHKGAKPTSVKVVISDVDRSEAMQRDDPLSSSENVQINLIILYTSIVLIIGIIG